MRRKFCRISVDFEQNDFRLTEATRRGQRTRESSGRATFTVLSVCANDPAPMMWSFGSCSDEEDEKSRERGRHPTGKTRKASPSSPWRLLPSSGILSLSIFISPISLSFRALSLSTLLSKYLPVFRSAIEANDVLAAHSERRLPKEPDDVWLLECHYLSQTLFTVI